MNLFKCNIKDLKDQRGTTAVEFAIILSLFITILFAIIEFGLLIYNEHIVTNAAREGVRAGIVYRTAGHEIDIPTIKTRVDSYADKYIISFGDKSWNTNVSSTCGSSDYVTITTQYRHNYLFLPFDSKNMSSTTKMKCE